MCTCLCAWRPEARAPPYILKWGVLGTLEVKSLIQLDWLARETQGSSCVYLSSSGLYPHTQLCPRVPRISTQNPMVVCQVLCPSATSQPSFLFDKMSGSVAQTGLGLQIILYS